MLASFTLEGSLPQCTFIRRRCSRLGRFDGILPSRPHRPTFRELNKMNQAGKALVVFAIAAMGLWGCAQGPAGGGASAERLRALEAKVTKLEDDFRGAVAARDQLRKKLTTAEDEKSQLTKQVDQLV